MNKMTLYLAALAGLAVVSTGGRASAQARSTTATPSDDSDGSETAARPTSAAATEPNASGSSAPAQPLASVDPPPAAPRPPALGIGFGLVAGGGIDDFVGSTMRDTTGIGGGWTVRATFGTRSYIAGELAYIGSAQSINRLGLVGRSTLYGNGAQAVLRVNATDHLSIQPFAYGGVAWRHYSLSTSSTNTSDVASSTDAFEVPLGGGIATYTHGIMFDLRAEYRFSWASHAIVPDSSGNSPLLDRWAVLSGAGVCF